MRIDCERARQRYPLTHAARQLMRVMPGEFGKLEICQQGLGAVSPEPILRSVLLPQPLGPINDTTSASRTEKLTPRTAVSAPPPLASAKRIVTLRYSRRTTGISDHRKNERRLRNARLRFRSD